MKLPYLVCFDIETTGLKAGYHEVIQLAAQAYDPATMEPVPASAGGQFESLMRPLHEERIQDEAMRVHKIPLEVLRQAPHPKAAWLAFLMYLKQFNPKSGKRTAPIACGKRIGKFDLPFLHAMSEQYSPKKGKQVLFNTDRMFDLEDDLVRWLWHDPNVDSIAMDSIREYFGMATAGAHTAMKDVQQTGYMITYFLKLTRALMQPGAKSGVPVIDLHAAFAGV